MGEAQTLHFYDFGMFEPVPEPQNQYYLSLETPGHFNNSKKNPKSFWGNIIYVDIKILEF